MSFYYTCPKCKNPETLIIGKEYPFYADCSCGFRGYQLDCDTIQEIPDIIDREYLMNNRDHIFVFGDNLLRIGHGGAAMLRDEENTYGFVSKKYPNNQDSSFYKPNEYKAVYDNEIIELKEFIKANNNKVFLISKLGAGLANKYNIYETIIEPNIKKDLKEFNDRIIWLF